MLEIIQTSEMCSVVHLVLYCTVHYKKPIEVIDKSTEWFRLRSSFCGDIAVDIVTAYSDVNQ